MKTKTLTYKINRQQGAVLVVSLIILLIMSTIGLSAMRTTILEEKMAGNFRNSNIAFQAAEVALNDAINDIGCDATNALCVRSSKISGLGNFDASCTNGLCGGWADNATNPAWEDSSKIAAAITHGNFTGAAAIPGVATQPTYLIEGQTCMAPGWAAPKYCYRILATGFGADANARRLIQAVYIAP